VWSILAVIPAAARAAARCRSSPGLLPARCAGLRPLAGRCRAPPARPRLLVRNLALPPVSVRQLAWPGRRGLVMVCGRVVLVLVGRGGGRAGRW
jgi:hypothetical protein